MRRNPHYTTSKDHKRAKELRHASSPHEQKLWAALRQHPQFKFRRQQPIHPYFADFACMQARLIIEIDGMSHDTQLVYDRRRDTYMQEQGFKILCFRNEDVTENLEGVVETILAKAEEQLASLHPLTSKN